MSLSLTCGCVHLPFWEDTHKFSSVTPAQLPYQPAQFSLLFAAGELMRSTPVLFLLTMTLPCLSVLQKRQTSCTYVHTPVTRIMEKLDVKCCSFPIPDLIELDRSGACRRGWSFVSRQAEQVGGCSFWDLQGTQDTQVIWVGVLLGDNLRSITTYILVFLGIL